ncbi:cytochrome P450 [Salinisphaera sp. SPP-AMP-43]|uniref:cytochrome P450 n=1 Tax=Salinisphaera sp. SPP-AMP-43 TaxID=3121288 RepID=UPI003C6E2E59
MTKSLRDLPSPGGLPFLGNIHQLSVQRLHRIIETWEAQLGSEFTFELGSRRVFVTSDPHLAQHALRERPESFRKLSSMTAVIDEMGFNGVFSAEGQRWWPQREMVTRALARKGLPPFFPTLHTITERLFRRWDEVARNGQTTDVVQDLTRFTVDVISTLSFGQDINTLEQTGDPIQKHLSVIFPMVTLRANLPFAYWRYIKLPQDRQLERSIAAVEEFVHRMIDEAKDELVARPDGPPTNLLQAMLMAAEEPGSGISDDIVYANVVTLLIAGEDTTAHTLAWAMYCMAERPELRQHMQNAAAHTLGEANIAPDYKTTEGLSLFESTAFEAMRFKPTVPLVFLEANEDVTLGDTHLPAGTPVFLALRASMKDENHFGDADDFDPYRWTAERHHRMRTHNGRAFMQFGAGPRVCPGRHLAILEIRMVLSMLARNFTFEFADDAQGIEESFSFTMAPHTLPLRLHRLR